MAAGGFSRAAVRRMADLTKTFLAQRFKRESPIPQEKQKRRKT
jgi:hypothetical protein